MTQDEKWLAKYNEVKKFIEANKRNPSKHDDTERGLYCNWIRHNKKLYNAGEMKDERMKMFKELIELMEEYKSIELTQQELDEIGSFLDNGMFLFELSSKPSTNNLCRIQEIQKNIIEKMNKYGFGFTDAISKCEMEGTADDQRTNPIYNDKLVDEIKNTDITIINGMSTEKNGSLGAFKTALGVYGHNHENEYLKLKEKYNVVDNLPSTSGLCTSTKKHKKMSLEDKIGIWVDVLKDYIS